uniref:Reverse transcriptase domain-containing protein n=1 Tax=Tanacetum cinerariifolium TaxID=118510 RepID=A0A6L2L7L6_TANCI|nr:hypothetical protein [Tanacetum cinerariifolium]
MMQSYCEMMSQQREQASQKEQELLEQEQAVEEKQEFLAEEQVANPSEPSPVSYFYNADYDNISTPSTTYTIHLTKSATIITNPSEPTRRIYHNHDIFYDRDDDEELFPDGVKRIQQILEKTSFDAITPDFSITDSLGMGDEHLSIISETKSDEVIKSSVKNLVPIPSEFGVTSDNENTLIDSSPKFDYLLEEFFGELAHIDPVPPGIKEADFDLEEEIRLVENFSYDNSSPRPPKELNEIVDTILESLSPSPIPVENSDSHMKEIDFFLATDDLMPPGIENDDYDLEGDIHSLEELLRNDPLPLPENESSSFDHHDDPSFPHPPLEPLVVEVFFDFEPNTGVLTNKVVKGISIWGYSLKSNPREFYHGRNFLSHSFVILFIQCLTLCSRFHSKTRTKCSNLDCPDCKDSRARGLVHRPLDL